VAPGVWSFQLAARARGLGSAWTTFHLVYERKVAELLGIPDTVTQIALLPVAYYTGDTFSPAPRRPAPEITYFNRWKQTLD
jgi:nitroreductase